jgi:type IV fimbrial biogenesis protein FimT
MQKYNIMSIYITALKSTPVVGMGRGPVRLHRWLGMTLTELMATLAIVSIATLMAAPMFKSAFTRNRFTSYANEFLSSINLARNEAAKRGFRVVLCKSSDSATCATSGNWEQGWIIFVDADNNGAFTSGEQVLRVHSRLDGSVLLVGNSPLGSAISYTPDGFARDPSSGSFQTGTLDFKYQDPATTNPPITCVGGQSLSINIAGAGRAKVVVTRPC